MKILRNHLFFLIALTFCLPGVAGAADSSQTRLTPVETRTFISGSCLITENEQQAAQGLGAAILAVLVPKAIEWVIGYAIDELTKVRKETSTSITEFYLYKFNPTENKYPVWNKSFGCITSITGMFETGSESSTLVDAYDYTTDVNVNNNDHADLINRLRDNGIGITEENLYSVYESRIVFSEDRSAFKYVSQYLLVTELLANRNSAGLVYTYKITGPGSTPDGSTYSVASMDFGQIVNQKEVKPLGFEKGKESGWISRIGMSNSSLLSFVSGAAGDASIPRQYTPVKFSVENIQTRNPSDTAKFTAAILGAIKETVASEISKEILPKDDFEEQTKLLDAKIAVAEANAALVIAPNDAAKALATLKLEKSCLALAEITNDQVDGC